jgi:hypothetical protein
MFCRGVLVLVVFALALRLFEQSDLREAQIRQCKCTAWFYQNTA